MSVEVCVWKHQRRMTDVEGMSRYDAICDGELGLLIESDELVRCYKTITARYPELDDLDDDAADESPWSESPLDCNRRYMRLLFVNSTEAEVYQWVIDTAISMGLDVFDPQNETLYQPEVGVAAASAPSAVKPWWKFW